MKAVILAAGKGTRMKSEKPKVIHKIAGVPLLEYVISTAKNLTQDVYVVIGHKADDVKKLLPAEKIGIKYCIQEPQHGTGHAMMEVEKAVGVEFAESDDVMILLGDVPLIQAEKLQHFYEIYKKQNALAAMLTVDLDDASGYGRVKRDNLGNFKGVVEDKDASAKEKELKEINTGIFMFNACALFANLSKLKNENSSQEYYLPEVLDFIRDQGGKCVVVNCKEIGASPAEVAGINSQKQLAELDKQFQRDIKDMHMSNGVSIVDPDNTYIEQNVEIGADTVIFPFTVIRKGVKIGKCCEVGPFAHLRAGTVLEDTAEVGDFVETKKAILKPHVKAKHLSYLGDVEIGARTNVGAGTIIANYDGKNKFKTIIEEDVFIGSGSILVAPLRVGKGAITGAGAVVTKNKDVQPNTTVIGIPAKEINVSKDKDKSEKK
ncbi:MAG: NTP transferase domain-containing protein [Planctomycetes bacterium]|nr:NTP transferase domain-containing protein [Planctomycetota bacterium]